jgi:hypothetical protein
MLAFNFGGNPGSGNSQFDFVTGSGKGVGDIAISLKCQASECNVCPL